MSLIWVFIAIITIGSLGVLILPLIRNRNPVSNTRETYDVAIYKDQLKEAEREHARGLLNSEQVDAVKTEIQRKLLAAAGQSEQSQTPTAQIEISKTATAIGLALFLSLGSVGIYGYYGSPSLGNLAYVDRDIQKERLAQNDNQAVSEMGELIDRLEMRLAATPDNLEGWLMLGRSAISLGQYPRAVNAYQQSLRLDPGNPEILVDYAEAITFMNQGRIPEDALKMLEEARAKNPEDLKAYYYIALARSQAGNPQQALQEWVNLLAMAPPDAPWIQTVQTQISNAAQQASIDPKSIKPSPDALRIGADNRAAAKAQAAVTTAGPTQKDVEAAEQMSADDRQAMIRSMVDRLASRLEENPDDRQGWIRLAKAYEVLGETEKAKSALERADAASK